MNTSTIFRSVEDRDGFKVDCSVESHDFGSFHILKIYSLAENVSFTLHYRDVST